MADEKEKLDALNKRINELEKERANLYEERYNLEMAIKKAEPKEYEIVVDLQSFVMEFPEGIDNPNDAEKIRPFVIEKMKEMARDGEIHLDQFFVEEIA